MAKDEMNGEAKIFVPYCSTWVEDYLGRYKATNEIKVEGSINGAATACHFFMYLGGRCREEVVGLSWDMAAVGFRLDAVVSDDPTELDITGTRDFIGSSVAIIGDFVGLVATTVGTFAGVDTTATGPTTSLGIIFMISLGCNGIARAGGSGFS